jgi:hypothetical protein
MEHHNYYFKFLESISKNTLDSLKSLSSGPTNEYFCQNDKYPNLLNTYKGAPDVCKNIGVKVTDIPILNNLGFFKELRKEFTLLKPFFLELPSNFTLTWHTDGSRSVSIIIPLEESHSHTLFAVEGNGSTSTALVECKYNIGRAYALNTKISHCILNLSDTPRVVVSIGLGNQYRYTQVREFCLDNNLIDLDDCISNQI